MVDRINNETEHQRRQARERFGRLGDEHEAQAPCTEHEEDDWGPRILFASPHMAPVGVQDRLRN